MFRKTFIIATALFGTVFAAETATIGSVNFATCVTESKLGKKEQENLEVMRKQMGALVEKTEKELKEIAGKFEDTEFLDSLSPKGEEELKLKHQTLEEDLARYQNQYYQLMQQAQYQLIQKLGSQIAKASEAVANDKKLDYVLNKEACFFGKQQLDVTQDVIAEMDKQFELQAKEKTETAEKKAG